MASNIDLSIGDISISIDKDRINETIEIPPSYTPFIKTGAPDISLQLHPGEPAVSDLDKVFESRPIWSLHRSNDRFIFDIYDSMPGIERILIIAPDLARAVLYFQNNSGFLIDPFTGPTMELLIISYLAQGTGVILHSCGIEIDEKGYLFLGESGAGKSTLARLWDKKMGIDVLSDDRIILRKTGGQFWMYGTPWHGEAKFISCRGVKLEKIFFLHHGQVNEKKKIYEAAAVQNLVTCSFPPFWDAKGMSIALALFSELASAVTCYNLGFRPDQSAIEFIYNQIT